MYALWTAKHHIFFYLWPDLRKPGILSKHAFGAMRILINRLYAIDAKTRHAREPP